MQFTRPTPFAEAIEKLGNRSPIVSQLTSAEWRDVPVALRERAFFSSRVESARFLQRGRDAITDLLTGARETLPNGQVALKAGSRAAVIRRLQEFAVAEGLGPLLPEDQGTIKDITSERRLGLIVDTQVRQAHDFGYWKQGMDADVLDEFPAQRFVRVQDVEEARDAHVPYEDQVALKTDLDFWTRINEDFGVPWGPWGWGCGHDVEDVDRAEAEELGLLQPGQRVKPVEQDFNARLQASTRGLEPDLLAKLRAELGEQVVIEGDTIRWRDQRTTLDTVLRELGLDKKAKASADDMRRLREELKEANPARAKDVISSISGADSETGLTADKINAAVQEFLDYVPPALVARLPKISIDVKALPDANGSYWKGRMELRTDLSQSELKRVVHHEMMHWIHLDGSPEYRAAIKTHFEARTAGEAVQQLPGYSSDIVGKKDDWFDSYAGRIYSGLGDKGEGWEVPTRYIEWLTKSPDEMARRWNDPTFRETLKIVLTALF
ncbi:MAG TPA: hypothetical protein VNO52_15825 [Methylomirabilota bacterium]|nr:hypothetical protein [Methylomirabilota bacterium]